MRPPLFSSMRPALARFPCLSPSLVRTLTPKRTNSQHILKPVRVHHVTTSKHWRANGTLAYSIDTAFDARENASAEHRRTSLLPFPRLEVQVGGEEYALDYIFLRDSCQCPQCIDPSSKQRKFRTGTFFSKCVSVQPELSIPKDSFLYEFCSL